MLSDEVLDSIQILKFFHDKCTLEKSIGMMQVYRVDELAKAIETILNLIEKQSKEIEELKEKNRQGKMRIVQLENEITARIEDVNQYYTPNDKIKAKIEFIKSLKEKFYYEENVISVLQSLLEKE